MTYLSDKIKRILIALVVLIIMCFAVFKWGQRSIKIPEVTAHSEIDSLQNTIDSLVKEIKELPKINTKIIKEKYVKYKEIERIYDTDSILEGLNKISNYEE